MARIRKDPLCCGPPSDKVNDMPKTVLIVDDSMFMLATIKAKLDRIGLLLCIEKAGDGRIALEKIRSGYTPDLIITDMNMPNIGGIELVKAIRAMPKLHFTPIIAMAEESSAAKRDEGKKVGVTAWLVKPVNTLELVAVTRYVLPGAIRVAQSQ